jgi:hypothetical protein
MKVPPYDLFSGSFGEGDAIWLGAIEGLGCETRSVIRRDVVPKHAWISDDIRVLTNSVPRS